MLLGNRKAKQSNLIAVRKPEKLYRQSLTWQKPAQHTGCLHQLRTQCPTFFSHAHLICELHEFSLVLLCRALTKTCPALELLTSVQSETQTTPNESESMWISISLCPRGSTKCSYYINSMCRISRVCSTSLFPFSNPWVKEELRIQTLLTYTSVNRGEQKRVGILAFPSLPLHW